MEKKKKVKFTTNINKELLKKIKVKAIEEGKNVNEILEELINLELKEDKKGGEFRYRETK